MYSLFIFFAVIGVIYAIGAVISEQRRRKNSKQIWDDFNEKYPGKY